MWCVVTEYFFLGHTSQGTRIICVHTANKLKGVEPHMGHLNFQDLRMKDEPPKHLISQANGACIHETHKATAT